MKRKGWPMKPGELFILRGGTSLWKTKERAMKPFKQETDFWSIVGTGAAIQTDYLTPIEFVILLISDEKFTHKPDSGRLKRYRLFSFLLNGTLWWLPVKIGHEKAVFSKVNPPAEQD